MAKRGRRPRTTSLLSLVQELSALDTKRQALVAQIKNALGADVPAVASVSATPVKKRGGRRKGFKMSAEARAKISAAAKKRWAAHRKAEK